MAPRNSNSRVPGTAPAGRRLLWLGWLLLGATVPLASQTGEEFKLTDTFRQSATQVPTGETGKAAGERLQQRVLPYTNKEEARRSRQAEGPAEADDNTVHLQPGRSLFLNSPQRLRKVYVSNPAVLDCLVSNPNQVVATGKAVGTSSVVLWDETGQSAAHTVLVDMDTTGLQASLRAALPGDEVTATAAEGRIRLSGVVSSDAVASQAAAIAGIYSKEVINALVIDPRHATQVELRVRIAEIDRSKLSEFGINFLSTGKNTGGITTGGYSPPNFPQIGGTGTQALLQDVLNLFYFNTDLNIGATIKAMEDKGLLQMLAEPNLTTMDGQAARFLAGGEFPYPVIQGSNGGFTSVTIQFRPYGVHLQFTPYVHPDGSIRLKVNPEVSSLDYTNAVKISGYTIPAISTRKAETEIELQNGQSFAISGLLDRRITDQFSKIPWIGDIPVLGELFRSHNYNHAVNELIVIVTPSIVQPLQQPIGPPPALPDWAEPFMKPGQFDKGLPAPGAADPKAVTDHEHP